MKCSSPERLGGGWGGKAVNTDEVRARMKTGTAGECHPASCMIDWAARPFSSEVMPTF